MKLTVFNGSPRVLKSNTKLLLERFLDGFGETAGNEYEIGYLALLKEHPKCADMFRDADTVILAFPLYTDCMPAAVKKFIEKLEPFCGREGNPDIGFIVQSGFRETCHSRVVERYLEKLAARLGCRYLGTVIRGGVEGIQVMPESMTRKLFAAFRDLGAYFGRTGEFDHGIVARLGKPERYSALSKLGYRLLALFGITNFYWDSQLKANKAHDRRFARPYDHRQ